MQQSSTLPSSGCAIAGAIVLALTSVLAWSAGRMSSRPHGNWDVPSADVAASSHPLRSVGERSDDNARAHHAGLVKEIVAANTKEGFELVIYGDSIMETLRGTDHGLPCGRAGCPEGPSILRAHFGDRWRTAVVATGADQTGHLLHLLRSGGTPSATKAPSAAVLLIGTNDMGVAASHGAADPSDFAAGAVVRLKSIVAHLRAQLPATTLLLAGLLPRGFAGDRTGQWQTRRPGVDERDWPNPFSQGIAKINAALRLMAASTRKVHYVDCGEPYVKEGKVVTDLMPDFLHPNGPGMEALASCLERAVTPLMESDRGS